MDNDLIAPCPDHKWRIDKRLEPRIPDLAPLIELNGKSVLLPANAKYWPKPESLEWRMRRLRRPA